MGYYDEILARSYSFDGNTGNWLRTDAEAFNYSDGDVVEKHILTLITQANDICSASLELREYCVDWPTTYHLSTKRASLLRPLQNFLHGRILEVGAGMGAVTRFLGESKADILALEGSALRASAIRARCRDLPNVTVLAESFHQFDAVKDFDVIVLVGVLEYARKFFELGDGDPVDRMLQHARSLLRPGGVLILAIENQLGLKYFAGSAEDHVGVPMYGIEDLYSRDTVVTFGQKELMARLASSGFPAQNWWFPFPDYKLPVTVFSSRISDSKMDLTPLLANSVGADIQISGGRYFSLEQAWGVIARNGLVPSLANSFLVLASDEERSVSPDNRKILGYYYSMNRRQQFAKEMMFEDVGGGKVEVKKRALFTDVYSVEGDPISMDLQDEELIEGKNWQTQLFGILNRPEWSVREIADWAQVWYDAMIEHGKLATGREKLTAGTVLHGNLFDAIPRNLMITTGREPKFFDQEWRLKRNIELGYLLFRGIYLELAAVTNVARPADGTTLNLYKLFRSVAQSLGFNIDHEDMELYAALERDIMNWVAGLKNWHTTKGLMDLSLTVRGLPTEVSAGGIPLGLERLIRKILVRPVILIRKFMARIN